MGVDFTWLAVDRCERVYVLWADKWGAHPVGSCLEDGTARQAKALRELLQLDVDPADQPAFTYDAIAVDAPTRFTRRGGRGVLTLADLPQELRPFAAARLDVTDPPDTLEVAGIEGLTWRDAQAEVDDRDREAARVHAARRSRSARILAGDEEVDASTAKRAHLQQIAAYLVATAAYDTGEPRPDLTPIFRSLHADPVLCTIETAGWPADLDVPPDPRGLMDPRTQSRIEAYEAAIAVSVAGPDEAASLREAVERLVGALTEALDERRSSQVTATPARLVAFRMRADVVLGGFPPPPRATWLAVGRDDRVFVFVTDARGARPADVLERADAEALAALRRLLFDDSERLTGPASYYERLATGSPTTYLLAGGSGSLKASDLPGPWADEARSRVLTHDRRQPGRIDVAVSVEPAIGAG